MELPAGLREKYDREREKRLRPDKMAQYSDIRDPMLHDLNIDPWSTTLRSLLMGIPWWTVPRSRCSYWALGSSG